QVTITPYTDGRWSVDVADGLAEGYLDAEGIEWFGGALDASHGHAVARFLSREADWLWALAQQDVDREAESDPKVLVDAIWGPSPQYKRRAMDALVVHADAVTPLVLELLDAYRDKMVAHEVG